MYECDCNRGYVLSDNGYSCIGKFPIFLKAHKMGLKLDIIYFIRVALWRVLFLLSTKNSKVGDPYKMSNFNVVQSCWNFA